MNNICLYLFSKKEKTNVDKNENMNKFDYLSYISF